MTPRPKKHRHCLCPHRPASQAVFKPAGTPLSELPRVVLAVDELEALRLCDGVGLTQEEAGSRMGVSRGTVQRLVSSGRRKLVEAVVEGHALIVAPRPDVNDGNDVVD